MIKLHMALRECYMDWTNYYLTLEKMAEDYEFSEVFMEHCIDKGRDIHETIVNIHRMRTVTKQNNHYEPATEK